MSYWCFFVQMLSVSFLLYQLLHSPAICKYAFTMQIVLLRFACTLILHVSFNGSLKNGLRSMKLVINHSYRFENSWEAFIPGLMQTVTVFMIENTNLLVILSSHDALEVVMNFLACSVINDFSAFFFAAQDESIFNQVMTEDSFKDLYQITRTTSSKCTERKAWN